MALDGAKNMTWVNRSRKTRSLDLLKEDYNYFFTASGAKIIN